MRSCVSILGSYFFFFQAEDGIRELVRSRGLGDVYKRQQYGTPATRFVSSAAVDVTIYVAVSNDQVSYRS